MASQAGRTLRNLRRMANNARDDLRAGLGPEFANFDPADLNPRNFVRKHLLGRLEDDWNDKPRAATPSPRLRAGGPRRPSSALRRDPARTTPRAT